ncbi:MAG: hypothetical protein J6Y08_00850 [Clostridiales bacterium]|nr:hypothetical protein [Clostridiales bacterium]
MLLLLLVWGVSFWFFYSPPGDPDFSQYIYWTEDLMEAEDYYAAYEATPVTSVLTWGNALYAVSFFGYCFLLYLIGLFYFVLYVCDLRQVKLSHAPKIYFTRIWWIILFTLLASMPFLVTLAMMPPILIFLIPALYALPGLVLFEKKDAFTSSWASAVKTHGHKLSIIIEVTAILLLWYLLSGITGAILHNGSIGFCLVKSFITAYFTLVLARNMGLRYHMITILEQE